MQHANTLGSVPLGRYNGIPVRVHISFLLVGTFVFFFRMQAGGDPVGNTGFILLIWLAAVLLHEAGHCFMVHRIGGNNEMIVLTPFGGLSFHSFPQQAGKDLWVALSGPLVSFFGLIVSAGGLWVLDGGEFAGLWGGVGSNFFATTTPIVALRLAAWINLGLVLVNLLPTIPLDGGWSLHALVWPALGDQRAWHLVRRASHATALGILVVAILMGVGNHTIGQMPLWLPLTILAIYCFCSSAVPLTVPTSNQFQRESEQEEGFAAEASAGSRKIVFEEDDLRQQQLLLEEHPSFSPAAEKSENQHADSALDEVLQCVYDRGMESLTTAQREVLQEAAKRYRLRQPK